MNKLNDIKSKLHLLSDEQLDIIYRLILTWKIEDNKIQTDENLVKKIYENTISPIEDPLKSYTEEELLEEYGVLFYNQENTNNTDLNEISIEYNYNDTSSKQFIKIILCKLVIIKNKNNSHISNRSQYFIILENSTDLAIVLLTILKFFLLNNHNISFLDFEHINSVLYFLIF